MSYSLYILITGGDCRSVWATDDLEHALGETRMAFLEHLFDFQRGRIHKGDIILADDKDVSTDYRLIRVDYFDVQQSVTEVEIPFQAWIDETLKDAAEERVKEAEMKADPEWEEYQRLCKKFQDRRSPGPGAPSDELYSL